MADLLGRLHRPGRGWRHIHLDRRMTVELRDYQLEALEASANHASRRQLIVLPTGTGKTVIFSELARRRLEYGRVLILVHRDELVRQTVAKLEQAGRLHLVGVIQAGTNQCGRPITVASVQTLSRARRLHDYVSFGLAETIIIDESHHAPAPSYRRIIAGALHDFDHTGLVVGVTATPDRETETVTNLGKGGIKTKRQAGMGSVFDQVVYARSLTDMIDAGWLVDLVPATATIELGLKDTKSADWTDAEAAAAVAPGLGAMVGEWKRTAGDRQTVAFLPDVETSMLARNTFGAAGIHAAHIDGTTPTEVRQRIYESFRRNETQVITNCMVLTEGWDMPQVRCIVVGRPTKSRALFAQMVGRGTRLYPGKDDCMVLSVASHDPDINPLTLQRYLNDAGWADGEPSAPRRAKLAAEAESRDDLTKAMVWNNKFQARPPKLTWRNKGGIWSLPAGNLGTVLLEHVSETEVRPVLWPKMPLRTGTQLGPLMTLEGAVGFVEHWAHENNVSTLSNPKARWRKQAPSPKQIALAQRLGIKLGDLDKGELADKITETLDERRRWSKGTQLQMEES